MKKCLKSAFRNSRLSGLYYLQTSRSHRLKFDRQYQPCELEGSIRPDESEDAGARSVLNVVKKFISKTWIRIKIICSPPFTRVTVFLIISRICLFPG